jgi:diguanylate cyclase (GGDEF)-like protein
MVVTPMRAPWKGAVVAHTDVTERRATEEALRAPARADPLTGLPTRVLFADRVGQALLQRQRDHGHLALLFLDLDRFKPINDTLGHQAGDAVLCEVAHRLRHVLRKSDTVARMGGDEFVVLLPDIAGRDAAAVVARKLLDALDAPIAVEQHQVRVTASIGVVLGPAQASDVSTLLRKADIAMYAAKRTRCGFAFDTSDDEPGAGRAATQLDDERPGAPADPATHRRRAERRHAPASPVPARS